MEGMEKPHTIREGPNSPTPWERLGFTLGRTAVQRKGNSLLLMAYIHVDAT